MVMATAAAEAEANVSLIEDEVAIGNAADLRWYVFGLFFIFGGITSLNDVLIPKLKHLFSLNYFEAMLSGIICMAIVGGAIVPVMTGLVADAATLRAALVVPFACYAIIAAFAVYCWRTGGVSAR